MPQTQRQILELQSMAIKEQSKKIGQLAIDVSTALNEIQDIKHHLYNDNNTNGSGAIERSKKNEVRIYDLEQREKIYLAKWGMAAAFAGMVGSGIVYLVNRIWLK